MTTYNNKIKILYVEDEEGDKKLLRMYIKKSSIKAELFYAGSLQECFTIADEEDIDLVFLDLSLPDSQGFKTLINFFKEITHIPVIVMTGLNDDLIGSQSIKAGAQDYLIKGNFDENLLTRTVNYSLHRFKSQQKLKEFANKLSISEKRHLVAQEMAHFGNWEMDLVSNEMSWTDEVYRIFGYPPRSINPVLSDYLHLVHPEDSEEFEDTFSEVIKDGKLRKIDHKVIVNGRKIKYVSTMMQVLYDESENKAILVGAVQDITDKKMSEQLLIEQELSNKSLKIRDDVFENLTFQVRTPLSSLVSLSYLMENNPSQKELAYHINDLKDSIKELHQAMNNLSNFSLYQYNQLKIEEVKFSIRKWVQDIEMLFKLKTDEKNINFTINVSDDIPNTLQGDMNKINQIVYNLIDNAIKFCYDNGNVILNFSCKKAKGNNINLIIKIEDNGKGFDEKELKRITKTENLIHAINENEEFAGLGITIVNKLIDKLDGTIQFNTKKGKGTNVSVILPVKIIQDETNNSALENTKKKPTAPLKILLVEDHFLNQLATKKVLTKWSDFVKVDIAENGMIGYEKFRAHNYDLILMDLQMPIMNGFQSTEKIREHDATIPIVALTASASSQEKEKARDIGMNDYISKPITPQDLYSTIMKLI